MPGDINILTDPIAYVGKVANTTESSGGAEALYQSIVGLVLILVTNGIVRKVDNENAFF